MIFLVFLWGLSFLTISGTICYGVFRNGTESSPVNNTPLDLGEFVRDEIHHLLERVSKLRELVKPHTSRLLIAVLNYCKRGHVAFSERLFGRILSERGKAASFFLKYIAEHKENIRSGLPKRIGY